MKGTIINQQKFVITIASETGLYQAELGEKQAQPGYAAEFEPLRKPALGRLGTAKLLSLHEYAFDSEDLIISKHLKVEGYRIMDCPEDPYLAAEGKTLEEAFTALSELARKYRANALLQLKVQFKVNRLLGSCLFKLTCRAGYLAKEDEPAEARSLGLPMRLARFNSVNRAKQRYLRVLAVCAVLIFCPILLKYYGQGLCELWQLQLGLSALLALLGASFCLYFPCTRQAYLLRAAKRLTI
ncbi:MAG: hypothetical protein K6F05_02745 [Succinivibrio sp.]|nr:hypothetical protein [Succinivibrio sp.]